MEQPDQGDEKPASCVSSQEKRQSISKVDELDQPSCGYGKWRPDCLQCFAVGKWFVFFACLMTLLQSMVGTGYTRSVVTTIEKRFQLNSSTSGFIISCYEMGALLVVTFVSYFGGKGHRPKWIAVGSLLMFLGTFVFTVPHFAGTRYIIDSVKNKTGPNVCEHEGMRLENPTSCEDDRISHSVYVLIFVAAQLLLGFGTSPIFTLGTTYVDDNVPRKDSALYMGILYCMGAIGPALGFVFGAAALTLYVDFGSIKQEDIPVDPSDARWVGAWWAGYVFIGIAIAATSIPLFGFPKKLKKIETEEEQTINTNNEESGDTQMKFTSGKFSDLPRAVLSLFLNPVYICITMAGAMEVAIATGFITFMPKFIETQYSLSPSSASLLTGTLIPGAAGGTVFGGFLVRKFNMNTLGTARLSMICIFISFLCYSAFFPLHCNTLSLAGVSVGYEANIFEIQEAPEFYNVTSGCNFQCGCTSDAYQPVCGINGITYFSPCHAGCEQTVIGVGEDGGLIMNFTNCACISEYFVNEVTPSDYSLTNYATYGRCERDCSTGLGLFMAVLISVVVITAITQIPIIMTTLRCVAEPEKPLALGMQFVLIKALSYVPAPMYYGKVIDNTCMLWETVCGDEGSCWEYDLERFRFVYLGLSLGLKFLSLIFVTLAFIICKKKYNRMNKKEAPTKEEEGQRMSHISQEFQNGAAVGHPVKLNDCVDNDHLLPLVYIQACTDNVPLPRPQSTMSFESSV
ncbi:solute carrier organic anion transporter family member 5A1-like [Saccoglossus kowalevskii]|uniref:Solute carrier organic anion transporter family member n=1 Tax=Saccoglossus kowalevskii TaxID=10224 RepID=A0ABM0GUA1_SACKO|nr:PREDICTED: solute carrier organic anion transporter family member 5A1-like [Saccoglossus kowalevskii]